MRRFLTKALIFTLLAVAVNLGLLVVLAPDPDTMLRAVVDKEALLRRTGSPKIVFIGGSSLGFGLDSARVDAAFPEHAVVNMGLQGSIGLRYMLRQVEDEIGSGDVVVLNPEFPQFLGMANGDDGLVTVWQAHPEGRRHLDDPRQIINIIRNVPLVLSRRFEGKIRRGGGAARVYRRGGFNDYGDVVSHLDEPGADQTGKALLPGYSMADFDEDATALVNRFTEICEARGARVFLIYPAITEHHAHQNRAFLEAFDARLNEALQLSFLGTPAMSAQNNDQFFDTVYHLTREGRAVRTERIIAWLGAAGIEGAGNGR